MVEPTISGIWPRDEPLIRATWRHDKDLLEPGQLRAAQRRATDAVVALQRAAGCRPATDGQIAWQDLLRPVAEATAGIEVGGLVRFRDTNTFLRRPILSRRLTPDDLDPAAFLRHSFTEVWPTLDEAKIVLPAPTFMVRIAQDEAYGDAQEASTAVARLLHRAARAAVDAGASVVQFNDPILLTDAEPDVAQAHRLLGLATRDLDATIVYYPYGGDAAPVWTDLARLPCHALGVDFLTTDLDDLDGLPAGKALLAGLVDGRSSRVEDPGPLAGFLARLGDAFPGRTVHATHVFDLEFVPSEVAQAKLTALAAACHAREVAA